MEEERLELEQVDIYDRGYLVKRTIGGVEIPLSEEQKSVKFLFNKYVPTKDFFVSLRS